MEKILLQHSIYKEISPDYSYIISAHLRTDIHSLGYIVFLLFFYGIISLSTSSLIIMQSMEKIWLQPCIYKENLTRL